MRFLYALVILFLPVLSYSQDQVTLNPEERAYLFHIVKKSPILDENIGRYFEYQGPDIRFANGNLNYDSVEAIIINNPDFLLIRGNEIAKSTKGILAEASNKCAIWELNKMLLAKRSKDKDFANYAHHYAVFEEMLMQDLPATAKDETGTAPHPRIETILNPSLALDDKVAQLNVFKGMTHQDELLTIQAISNAINKYVEKRSFEIYQNLGGIATDYKNVLTAAGDGSLTSGLLDEREKDEKGKWNKGLPKAIGLFPYEVKLSTPKTKKEEPKVEPLPYTITDFQTVGNNKVTNLHFDVWGYNASKQTTVVIEKNGKSYHLFGSGDTRFLSPDSTFSAGNTFQEVINELEFKKIGDLNEKIEGKRGYDYWIAHYNEKRDETELKIIKNEKAYSDMGYSPITTSDKPSRKVKKSKKRAVKAGVGADNWEGAPTTSSDKNKKGKSQSEIVYLYERFQWYKAKIKELEIEKAEAIDLRASYQVRLDKFKQLMGLNWVDFTEKDGLYTFADSATFDIYTQEFQFPASSVKEDFEVRLIAIPEHCLSEQADEVMLHISLIDSKPNYNARLQLNLTDLFESNSFELKKELLTETDSLAVRQFFEAMLTADQPFKIVARGQGIGEWNGVQVVKNNVPNERTSYGSAGKMDTSFVRLRFSELFIQLDRSITIEVNSFTDPVKSDFKSNNAIITSLQSQFKLSNNDILSAYRSYSLLKKFKDEINYLAGVYMTREEAKIVIDRFNREYEKVKIGIGPTSVKITEFGK